MTTQWKSFVNRSNKNKKTLKFRKFNQLELEKKEFYKIRENYRN